jgi:uncharacterized protein YmfQ (DUF2313 family)
MLFKDKMAAELPPGSYRISDHPEHFAEMTLQGKFLDDAHADNRRIVELLAVDIITETWQCEMWESELAITPPTGSSIAQRIAAIQAKRRNVATGNETEVLAAAKSVLGYNPTIINPPKAFWLRYKGGFTSESGHYLVDDEHKFAIWIVLDHTKTSKPYNVTPLIKALRKVLFLDCASIGVWFDDNGTFDYLSFPPWPGGGDSNITT